jgi:hypothetical protein
MNARDGFEALLEEDGNIVSIDDFLRNAPPGCLFCRLGDLGEGGDD